MSITEKFTEEEIFLLSTTPSMIGSSMAFAEGSGLGTVKEIFSSAKSVMSGIKQYPENQLIQAILPNLEDRKEAMAQAKEYREKGVARMKELGVNSHEKMRELLIKDCQEVSRLLAEKSTPEEAAEYKEWSMSVAENVAKAAKEGGFLGIGGTRISQAEIELFNQIAGALGTSSSLA
jgi:ribosomal 30S subunit maturation factor RimM